MTGPFAERLFRIAFVLAGCYNLAFGLWAAVWPLAFFQLFDVPLPRYPGIWACLGMVVGVYGLLYWHAAWKLETAWPIIAVGLLGKVLGPIGMVMSFGDDWPRRLGMICVYNDLIWWLPFGLFLVRGTALGKRLATLAPWLCAITHALAFVAMPVLLQRGMLTESDAAARSTYIAQHTAAWTVGWAAWMLAAVSLIGFYAWWGSRLTARTTAIAGVVIAALGNVLDFSGEGLSILLLVERASALGENAAAFASVERSFTLLSAGAANGLYTLGGLLLMLATPDLPRSVRAAMWATWLAGAAMTVAGVMNHVGGLVASTVVLFPLLIAWTVWMAARWRRP
jgi:small multidrug resistance pump